MLGAAPLGSAPLAASGGAAAPTGPTSYTLALAVGSFAETGTANSFARPKRGIGAGAGTFALASTVQLAVHHIMPEGQRAFVVSGRPASTYYGFFTTVATGSFVLTGPALAISQPVRGFGADVGSIAVTGAVATLHIVKILQAAVGSFAITTTPESSKYGYTANLPVGSFAITPSTVKLASNPRLLVTADAIAIQGRPTALAYGHRLQVAAGSFALTGVAAFFARVDSIALATGSYLTTGVAARIKAARVIPLAAGSFAVAGTSAALTPLHHIPLRRGSFLLAAPDVRLARNHRAVLPALAFSVSGLSDAAHVVRLLVAAPGSFQIVTSTAPTQRPRTMAIAAGSFAVTGQPVRIVLAEPALQATKGTVTIVGASASFLRYRSIRLDVGIFGERGLPATLSDSAFVDLTAGARWGISSTIVAAQKTSASLTGGRVVSGISPGAVAR